MQFNMAVNPVREQNSLTVINGGLMQLSNILCRQQESMACSNGVKRIFLFSALISLILILSASAYGGGLSPEDKLFIVGAGAYEDKLWDVAALAFSRLLAESPASKKAEEVTHLLGVCHTQMKEYQFAIKVFTGFLEKYPKSSMLQIVLIRLGEVYLKSDNQNEAVKIFQLISSSRDIDKNADAAIFTLGETYVKMGKYKEAVEEFKNFPQRFT